MDRIRVAVPGASVVGYSVLSTVDAIRDRLIETLDPQSIILFGSRARQQAEAGADVDLLIVSDAEGRPIDRRIAVERVLSDRTLPLDVFVYTPEEMRLLFQAGSPFIEEVIETGRVLYMRKATEVWIREAEDELESARILQKHGKHRGACLHGQQCVEECLKALILDSGERPERTHDLLVLRAHALRLGRGIELAVDDAVFLNSVYKGRYPSEEGLLPHGDPSAEDGEQAVRAAQHALAGTKQALG